MALISRLGSSLREAWRHQSLRCAGLSKGVPLSNYYQSRVPGSAGALSLQIRDEVAQALMEGGPVVALESTIISHGMVGTLAVALLALLSWTGQHRTPA